MSKNMKEFIIELGKSLLVIIAFVIFFILFLFATPDQSSGESDWLREAERRLDAIERGEE